MRTRGHTNTFTTRGPQQPLTLYSNTHTHTQQAPATAAHHNGNAKKPTPAGIRHTSPPHHTAQRNKTLYSLPRYTQYLPAKPTSSTR